MVAITSRENGVRGAPGPLKSHDILWQPLSQAEHKSGANDINKLAAYTITQ